MRAGSLQPQLLLHHVADVLFVSRVVIAVEFLGERGRRRTQASMFAPLSTLGSASMLSTDRRIFSMDCTGDQRSADDSYTGSAWCHVLLGSSPAACRMEMHTRPSGYTG